MNRRATPWALASAALAGAVLVAAAWLLRGEGDGSAPAVPPAAPHVQPSEAAAAVAPDAVEPAAEGKNARSPSAEGDSPTLVEVPPRPPRPRGTGGAAADTRSRRDLCAGRVVDERGEAVPGVKVNAWVPGPRGVGGTVLAWTTTDDEGRFSFWVPRSQKRRRLHFLRPGWRLLTLDRLGPDLEVCLAPEEPPPLRGRFVDGRGRALGEDDMTFLFDRGWAAGTKVAGPEPTRVVFYPQGLFGQPRAERVARVFLSEASFDVERPGAVEGEVVLFFRGEPIARAPCAAPFEEVRFAVDAGVLRSWLADLRLEVEDGETSSGPVRVRLRRAPPLRTVEPLVLEAEAELGAALSFSGLPPGDYEIEALAVSGYAAARLRLREGAERVLALPLRPLARVRLLMDGATTGIEGRERADFAAFGRFGDPLPAPVRAVQRRISDRLAIDAELPAGGVSLLLRGNVLRLDLEPGGTQRKSWHLRAPRPLVLEARALEAGRADRPDALAGRVEWFGAGGRRLLARERVFALAPSGTARLETVAVAGAVLVRVAFGACFSGSARLEDARDGVLELVRDGPP